jgi:biotin carboxyl carrier protein
MSVLDSLLVGLFGMGVVFVVLIGLNLLLRLQSALFTRFSERRKARACMEEMTAADAEPSTADPEPPTADQEPPAVYGVPDDGSEVIISPGPGTVLEVIVHAGAAVKRGDLLLLLDAMNMEYEINATMDGTITQIFTSSGAPVGAGTPLLEIQ